jgi:predicted O-methyltransferase YrrM
MDFDVVASKLQGIPNMTRPRGRRVYDHLHATGAERVLEIGTAHGVSSAYMAAAVEERGGSVVTVDHVVATKLRDPQPGDVLARVGVDQHVERVLVDDSSYTWWIGSQVRAQTTGRTCQPVYDFIYVDGAHNWTLDGFSFFLLEKLLRPGGWMLFDDLGWSYGAGSSSFGPGQGPDALGLSEAEREVAHMQLVFDLLVVPHPAFRNFLVEDEDWGWAQKTDTGSTEVTYSSTASWRERIGSPIRRG